MPGLDGTGPLGKGPFTGRGRGFCIMKLPDGEKPEFSLGITAGEEQQKATFIEKGKEVIAMPAGNRTGPLGLGPMTGRAAGYCAGYPVPGYANPIPGVGFLPGGGYGGVMPAYVPAPYPVWGRPYGGWFGRGRGRGFGRGAGRGRWW